jgi:hypothetical protein
LTILVAIQTQLGPTEPWADTVQTKYFCRSTPEQRVRGKVLLFVERTRRLESRLCMIYGEQQRVSGKEREMYESARASS